MPDAVHTPSLFMSAAMSESSWDPNQAVFGVDPEPWHGTYNGYRHHGCRCSECRAARAAEQRRRLAEDPDFQDRETARKRQLGEDTGYRERQRQYRRAKWAANEAGYRQAQRKRQSAWFRKRYAEDPRFRLRVAQTNTRKRAHMAVERAYERAEQVAIS